MSETELKLLSMIRNHDNPEQALVTAIEIILSHLTHLESTELESVVERQGCV